MSAAAVAARQKEALVGAIGKLAVADEDEDDEEGGGENPLDAFGDFVKPDMSDSEIASKAKELGLRDDKAVVVLAQVLFDANVITQLAKRKPLLAKFLKSEKAQKALLGGVERLVGELFPEQLMGKVPLVLKAVYDTELVEEEVMLAWGEKASSKYVKKVGLSGGRIVCLGAVVERLETDFCFFSFFLACRTCQRKSASAPNRSSSGFAKPKKSRRTKKKRTTTRKRTTSEEMFHLTETWSFDSPAGLSLFY